MKAREEERRRVGVGWLQVAAAVGVMLGVGVWCPSLPTVEAVYVQYPDMKGDFCRTRRPTQCCDGRYDECSVPIKGTLCYCDAFCDRDLNPDCCPDFWSVCRGIEPPQQQRICTVDGVLIPHGQSRKINCNECECWQGQTKCESDRCLVEENMLNDINRRQYGWTATNYSAFWGRKASEGLTLRTGTWMPGRLAMHMYPIILRPDLSKIPDTFDPRRDKPDWWISDVSDQGWCAASWVFSTLGVAQDRVSIHQHRSGSLHLSPQHVLSCHLRGKNGCSGGQVESAWMFMKNVGGVEESCMAYESGRTSTVPACRYGNTLKSVRCNSGTVKRQADFYGMEPAYRISGSEEDIQWEILNNGPVQAIMEVHLDFFLYRRGVYTHAVPYTHKGSPATHSVRIIGWGVDRTRGQQPTKYWLAANSWGREWGEDGYFRIRRGTNESQIESFILAVHPQKEENLEGGRRRYRRRRKKFRTGGHHSYNK